MIYLRLSQRITIRSHGVIRQGATLIGFDMLATGQSSREEYQQGCCNYFHRVELFAQQGLDLLKVFFPGFLAVEAAVNKPDLPFLVNYE